MTKLTVNKSEGFAPVYCKYATQLQPVKAWIGLSSGGYLEAYYSDCSVDLWAWRIDPMYRSETINRLLELIQGLAQELLWAEEKGDEEKVRELEEKIKVGLDIEMNRLDGDALVEIMSATEYFQTHHSAILQKLEDDGISSAEELCEGLVYDDIYFEEDVEDMLEEMQKSLNAPESFTVRELGCSAWETLEDMETAEESKQEALRQGLNPVITKRVEFGGAKYSVIVK